MKFSIYCCSPNVKGSRTQQKNDKSTMVSIRNISEQSLPSIQKKKRPWVFQDDYDFLKDEQKIFKLLKDENSPYINRIQQAVKLIQQIDFNDPVDIEERFSFILKDIQSKLEQVIFIILEYFLLHLFYKLIISFQRLYTFGKKFQSFVTVIELLNTKLQPINLWLNFIFKKGIQEDLQIIAKSSQSILYFLKNVNMNQMLMNQLANVLLQKRIIIGKSLSSKILGRGNNYLTQIKLDFKLKTSWILKLNNSKVQEILILRVKKNLSQKTCRTKRININPIKVKDAHMKRNNEPLGPIYRSVLDKKLFQREFYTQLSHINSLLKFITNSGIQLKTLKKIFIVIDKLIFDLQQF